MPSSPFLPSFPRWDWLAPQVFHGTVAAMGGWTSACAELCGLVPRPQEGPSLWVLTAQETGVHRAASGAHEARQSLLGETLGGPLRPEASEA